jgi:hypothetical protein
MNNQDNRNMMLREYYATNMAATLDSIRGLLLLAERYQNHPETKDCLNLLHNLILRLEQGAEVTSKSGLETENTKSP